jgi:hypothetical protein
MDSREPARLHALGRVVVGLALTVAPARAGASWIGRDAGRPAARVMIRAMGARDLAIGLGAAYTAGQGYGARPWQLAGVLADTADLLATLRARDALAPSAVAGVGAVAAGSVLLGLWFQATLD